MAELIRTEDSAAARDAARRLLAAGITPDVQRDGDEHVLVVVDEDGPRAVAVLAGEPVVGVDDPDPEESIAGPDQPGRDPDEVAEAPIPVEVAPPLDPPGPVIPRATPLPVPEPLDDAALAELLVDERGFVVVAVVDGDGQARALAAQLLEGGIGAEIVSAIATGHANPLAAIGDPQALQVLEVDVDRALAALGADAPPTRLAAPPTLDAPAGVPTPAAVASLRKRRETDEVRPYLGGRLNVTRRQLRLMIGLYVAALVLLPLGAFLLVRWILAPDVEMPDLPSQHEFPTVIAPAVGYEQWEPLAQEGAPRTG